MSVSIRNRHAAGQVDVRVIAAVLVLLAVALAAFFLLRPESAIEPVPAPAPVSDAPPLETVEPAKTEEERGDSARDVIAQLRAAADGPDYAEAHARAREFLAEGRKADAQILYFFAARGGYAPAAFELAGMYDPAHFDADASLMDEPDPFQAYRWYGEARDAGYADAEDRLVRLLAWAEDAAAAGDPAAEQLLLLGE